MKHPIDSSRSMFGVWTTYNPLLFLLFDMLLYYVIIVGIGKIPPSWRLCCIRFLGADGPGKILVFGFFVLFALHLNIYFGSMIAYL